MSDLTDRLDEIEARAEQRLAENRLGKSMARETDLDLLVIRDLLREARRLQAATDRVRALHVPFRIYDECECEDTTTPGHVDIEEVGITCNLLYVACRECCTSGVDIRYQTEDCAYDHDHRDTYCPTIAALDGDEP